MNTLSQNDPGFYREGGWGYDVDAELAWLDEHVITLGVEPGQRLLDVGCGDGTHAWLFALRGLEVVGIDPNPEAIATAVKPRSMGDEDVKAPDFYCVDLESIGDLGKFDVVFVRGVSWTGQPATDKAHAGVAKIHDLLRRRGRIIVVRSTDLSGKIGPGSVPGSKMWNPSLAEFDGLLGDAFSAQIVATIPPFVLVTGRRK